MSRYNFENGLRKVVPYHFSYQTHVKPRWVGRTLVEVYTSEFGEKAQIIEHDLSQKVIYVLSNYGKKGGPVKIEGLEALCDRKIERFDMICNSKHMHEPSVPVGEESTSPGIPIVFENDELLVVNKPCGIPTHPTGNYYYNSVTEICKYELGLANVWPCHRLDKVTSGILILGKTKEAGIRYLGIIQNQKDRLVKEYVARVDGEFPTQEVMVNCPIFSVNSTGGYIKPLNAESLPINSTTLFKRIQYCPKLNQSIVICKPLTGRMHQIRIHLRNLGHPISNDYIYNPVLDTLPNHEINVLNGEIEKELYRRVFEKFPSFGKFQAPDVSVIKTDKCINLFEITNWHDDTGLNAKVKDLKTQRQAMLSELKQEHGEVCTECRRSLFDTDKDMTGLGIWLHAYRYEYLGEKPGFSFQTDMPTWARELN
ncbi:DRAP deaminase and pseudouridylate synthase [Suhomyces tanzawaensis NRRL Y-17324]|uniref:DRAP deaminase and pseudouridylate synthase n=1 Tax=Suhomyces tanzawaensis NRRL Y-17324 TaxID=984487 RepID=A0A1E4SDA8_9ASCO|nr:DRAP deaminase and pseudouridylate synthase [Suhomyces tanzawaensis NRRL Y-17324]ODV77500.1 DRAP deaminase and pseudouridylate synthase [Suhomyces tanzawaensis NRRL Y-17324]